MRRALGLISVAAALGGCGSTMSHLLSSRHLPRLCVGVGLALRGHQAAASRALLAGLSREIPMSGLVIGEHRVGLCVSRDDIDGARPALAGARQAAATRRTIAYVGGLNAAETASSAAVLGAAGIALITPSVPPLDTPPILRTPATVNPAVSSALFLLPGASAQATARTELAAARGCALRHHGRLRCRVLSSGAGPLCTGLPRTRRTAPPRLCVLGGEVRSGGSGPAEAYGAAIGRLLVRSLRAVAAGGGRVADRADVLARLQAARLSRSPIGPLSFDASGVIRSDVFTAYTVRDNGRPMPLQTLRTH